MKTIPTLVALGATLAAGQGPRNLLTSGLSESALAAALLPAAQWHPYPTIRDRADWEAVPQEIRAGFIRQAQQYLSTTWERIPATVTLQYIRNGNRSNYDATNTRQREKLATLVLAEVFENGGRFLDDIANGIWAISEQTYWGSTAHLGMQRAGNGLPDVSEPIVDLFAAETGALLAWTDYLLGDRLDKVSPLLRTRIRTEVNRRVLTPAFERDDFWWMGFGERKNVNNWNPWINSNWLAAVLLLEADPQRRSASVYKIMRSLDHFINTYPDDGASDEGPGYWGRAGASLFDNLELLRSATNGTVDIYRSPLVRNMGQYIYRVYIKDEYFVPMGDASAKITPDAELVYQYGKRIGDPVMQGFGALLAQRRGPYRPGSSSPGRILPALLVASEIASAHTSEPLLGSVWLADLQLMAARSAANSGVGLYVAAWGGHNAQSHNHNDVGNFIVYGDGTPVLIDVGVETYSAKTFSAQRYEIWTMQSAYHNLPTINGIMQGAGREFQAKDVSFGETANRVTFSADIASAYPTEAAVRRWQRRVTLDRKASVVELEDRYELKEWKEPVRLNLMTSLRMDTSSPGEVRVGDRYVIAYDARTLSAAAEEIPLSDEHLRSVWGDRVARLVLTTHGTALQGGYRVVLREVK
ncbi:MAG TPA: heparinase II/III family protein [Gemmatimonadales bacterium]|nr:heparinase II/III family protein [Gemmatimonadales bacterium]